MFCQSCSLKFRYWETNFDFYNCFEFRSAVLSNISSFICSYLHSIRSKETFRRYKHETCLPAKLVALCCTLSVLLSRCYDIKLLHCYRISLFPLTKQGGSVMCNGTYEEQIEKPKNYFLRIPKKPKSFSKNSV